MLGRVGLDLPADFLGCDPAAFEILLDLLAVPETMCSLGASLIVFSGSWAEARP